MSDTAYIGERLKRIRLERKMSQTKLSAASGISQRAISEYENNKSTPTTTNLARLAQALQCEPGELFPLSHFKSTTRPIESYDAEELLEQYAARRGKGLPSGGRRRELIRTLNGLLELLGDRESEESESRTPNGET